MSTSMSTTSGMVFVFCPPWATLGEIVVWVWAWHVRASAGGRGMVVVGRGRAGVRRGHEGEDGVEGGGAEEGEAVDVAEVDLAREEEEGAEEEEEEDGAREVGIVH